MKQLAYWANRNKVFARIIVTCCHVLLGLMAYFLASQLSAYGMTIPTGALSTVSIVVIITLLVYACWSQAGRISFVKKKSIHLVIVLCSFCCMLICAKTLFFSNQLIFHSSSLQAAVEPAPASRAAEILESMKYRERSSLTKQEKRILKKELKHQVKSYTKAMAKNDPEAERKAGLIILAILTVLSLTVVLAALICGILCGGMEAIAVVLLLLGTAGLILALIGILNALSRTRRSPPGLSS